MARTRLRLRRLALALAAILAAQGCTSLVLLIPRVRAALRARLERALGRPVEVGHFGISVWSGLRLEAHYITVGEDPQFGSEFVLRADNLAATPRWTALLRGRLEFSSYSFERPSLNLVRASDAHWNFESWVAPASDARNAGSSSGAGRVARVSFTNGRINFKRGADKLPFSLAAVNGLLSPSPDGRWNLNFEAQPLRAGVSLQDAGTFEFAGTFPVSVFSPAASASATLPVAFSLEWKRASLSDALRLIAGYDYGVRGTLEVAVNGGYRPPLREAQRGPENGDAKGSAAEEVQQAWKMNGTLRIADVHRWDLPLQPGAPALNLSADLAGSADRREWQATQFTLEARRSKLQGHAGYHLGENPHASLRVISSSINLDDLLAWYRAFHPGVRPGTSIDGYLGADIELRGWPLSIVHAALATTGARLNIPGEAHPLELRRATLEADEKGVHLAETQVIPGSNDPGMHLTAHAAWSPGIPFEAGVKGGTAHLASFSRAIAALGLSPSVNPIRADGSVNLRLDWKGTARPAQVATSGTVALENVIVSGGSLRSEIALGKTRLDFLPGKRRIQISGAKAFGGTWTAALSAATLAGPWDFALTADRLNPADVIRGFTTQPQPASLLSRILPSQAAAPALDALRWPAWLRGAGTLAVNSFELGRLHFARMKGRLSVGEREVALQDADASAYGGRVRGDARATFADQARYAARVEFDGINVASLVTVAASTHQCCTGTGSGRLDLKAEGWTRDALLASLTGTGHADVRSGALLTFDLPASLEAGTVRPGRTIFHEGSSEFSFGPSSVRLFGIRLGVQSKSFLADGSVNYRGELDVTVTGGARPVPPQTSAVITERVRINGTLASPQILPPRKP